MNEKDPQKKRRGRPPKKKIEENIQNKPDSPKTPPVESIEFSEESVKFLNQIIRNSISNYSEEAQKSIDLQEFKIDVNQLEGIVSEYLDNFVIFGYTPDKRRILIRYAPTPQGYDAIRDLSRQFILRVMHNGEIPDFL